MKLGLDIRFSHKIQPNLSTSIKLQFYVIILIFLVKFFYFLVFSHNLKPKNNGIMLFCRAVASSFLEGIFSSEGVLKGESENDPELDFNTLKR